MKVKTRGWIRLHREIFGHWVASRSDYFFAWCQSIALANWEGSEILANYDVIECPRGSFPATLESLGKRWGWSKKKVLKFLEMLETQKMIKWNRGTHRRPSIITICNYDEYNPPTQSEGTENDTGKAPQSRPNQINKELKKYIRGGAKEPPPPEKTHSREVIAHYVGCFKSRFGSDPVVTDRDAGELKRVTYQIPLDDMKQVISKFINSNDPWFAKKGYSLSCLVENINALRVRDQKTKPNVTKF